MRFTQRSYQKEFLDGDDIPFADIKKNMQELNTINTLLGGHAITVKGLAALVGNRKKITVCEMGCGGGKDAVPVGFGHMIFLIRRNARWIGNRVLATVS